MDETLTDEQRLIIVNALNSYASNLPNELIEDELKDEIRWLIDLINLKECITVSRAKPSLSDWAPGHD